MQSMCIGLLAISAPYYVYVLLTTNFLSRSQDFEKRLLAFSCLSICLSVCLYVCLAIRMDQLASHWMIPH
jgi:hypothetical protein